MNLKRPATGTMSSQTLDATFWDHAEELRLVVLKSIFTIFCGVLFSLFFYQEIFQLLTRPLQEPIFTQETLKHERIVNKTSYTQSFTLKPDSSFLSASDTVIQSSTNSYLIPPNESLTFARSTPHNKLAIFSPIEGMLLTFKLCFWMGLAITSPLWLYFALSFVAPALSPNTHRLIVPFIACSLLFMSLGFLFAYFLTIPIANNYLTLFNQDIGNNLWSLAHYMDYTVTLLIGNGIAFESIVIGLFLVHYRKVSERQLRSFRRHFIILALIISAILTPPDVLTQLMLAIPLIILYEVIILYARVRSLHTHVD